MKVRERVLIALAEGNMTLKDISHAAKVDESTAHRVLKLLREEGLVERVGWGKYRILDPPSVLSRPSLGRPNVLSYQNSFLELKRKINRPHRGDNHEEEAK